MENLKLLSARIDKKTLQNIDAFAKSSHFGTRNSIINGILTAVLECADSQDIYDMVRYHRSLNRCITRIKIERP